MKTMDALRSAMAEGKTIGALGDGQA